VSLDLGVTVVDTVDARPLRLRRLREKLEVDDRRPVLPWAHRNSLLYGYHSSQLLRLLQLILMDSLEGFHSPGAA
jgi:hypothetical protein